MRKLLSILIIIAITFSQIGIPKKVFAATNDATIEVLGGGGGGGVIAGEGGGGGGGGEYRRCTETLSVQSYTVTVGVGGTANTANKTDSSFSGTGISMTAIGGLGTNSRSAGSPGTGGTSTNCDTAVANFDGGTPGAGVTQDYGGGAGGGAGYGGKGGNGSAAANGRGGGGGGGAGETGAGGDTTASATAGAAGSGGGGIGGTAGTGEANGSKGGDGVPATYHIVGGGGGGGSGGSTNRVGGACSTPGGGSGGGEAAGAGDGCRGEVRIVYVDSEVDATGGTETTSGIYRIHTFTTSGTFQVTSVTAVVIPAVETNFVTNLNITTATLNGTKRGGDDATEHGFAYSQVATFLSGVSTTTLGALSNNTSFSSNISSLTSNTTYFYRAYGTNGGGTSYGVTRSFYTGNSTATRKMLLFQGYRIKLFSNKLILQQK